jgi:hypothetical protein
MTAMPASGSSTGEAASTETGQIRLVVKSTFIELDEGPCLKSRFFQKSKTDSHLQIREEHSLLEAQTYMPGNANQEFDCGKSECSTSADSEFIEGASTETFPILESSNGFDSSDCQLNTVAALLLLPVHWPQQHVFLHIASTEPCMLDERTQEHNGHKARRISGSRPAGQHSTKRDTDQAQGSSRTTVMVRNIPNNYTGEMLLELIDSEGFASSYDFLYLPMDFGRQANLGYAFVNLVNPEVTKPFWKVSTDFLAGPCPQPRFVRLAGAAHIKV